MKKNILIIAGEPSGDMRGAEIVRELKNISTDIDFCGIGGDLMAREGVRLIEHIRNMSIVGLWEAIKNLHKIHSHFSACVDYAKKNRPDAVILIDYPGFNLKLAKAMKRLRIPVIYYILPQIWAWGSWRARSIKKYTDRIIVLFEFEKEFLSSRGIDAVVAGHPLTDNIPDGVVFKKIDPKNMTIALLPGSRRSEIHRILPAMLEAADILCRSRGGNIRFILAESSNVPREIYDSFLLSHRNLPIKRMTDSAVSALEECDFAFVTSGTATLETALMLRPFIILYSSSVFTAFFCWLLIKIKYIGLANIIAGKEVAPELLQDKATAENIVKAFSDIVNSEKRLAEISESLASVKRLIGGKKAPARAARAISDFLGI